MIRLLLVRFGLIAVMACAAIPTSSRAQTLVEVDSRVEATIAAQLEAFRAQDIPRAWGYASPLIQDLFGNQEQFARMVEQGYPMVWSPMTYRFGAARVSGSTVLQLVEVIGRDGQSHALVYEMIQISGDWRINGVQFLPQAPATV